MLGLVLLACQVLACPTGLANPDRGGVAHRGDAAQLGADRVLLVWCRLGWQFLARSGQC